MTRFDEMLANTMAFMLAEPVLFYCMAAGLWMGALAVPLAIKWERSRQLIRRRYQGWRKSS